MAAVAAVVAVAARPWPSTRRGAAECGVSAGAVGLAGAARSPMKGCHSALGACA